MAHDDGAQPAKTATSYGLYAKVGCHPPTTRKVHMIKREISPIAQLGSRPPEAGRIRMGVKSGKAMKSLDAFRFTSPDRQIIHDIAAHYGGDPRPWNDPSANPSSQWEVLTPASEIRVLLVPNGLSTWYELWAGRGCVRRCDGIEVDVPRQVGSDYELVQEPCLCDQEKMLSCDPHTRLQVVLPEFNFLGVWRLETKGWNAAEELPGMFTMLTQLAQQGRMLDAVLSIERRERMTPTGKRKFVVPRLAVRSTVLEMAAGGGTLAIGPAHSMPNLSAPALSAPRALVDDEPIDAEIIDDELLELEGKLRADAENFGLNPDQYVTAIKARAVTDGQLDRAKVRNVIAAVREGRTKPIAFDKGVVVWKSLTEGSSE